MRTGTLVRAAPHKVPVPKCSALNRYFKRGFDYLEHPPEWKYNKISKDLKLFISQPKGNNYHERKRYHRELQSTE